LRNLPPEKRLPALAAGRELHQKAVEILKNIARKEAWTPGEKRNLKEAYQEVPNPPNSRELQETIEIWVESANFGEQYLEALQEFYEAFYSEEESRIEKALKTSLETAQKLAEEAPFSALIETLSRGIRLDTAKEIDHWTLVPSYWISPLVVYRKRTTHQGIFMFGGRPEDESLVPGAQVPESMLRALKTLADPTRLRILRYLSEQTLTSSELARRLRLRAPTVTYHLNQLRLAGLVILTLTETNQKQYTTRKEAIQSTMDHLSDFLYQSQNKKA
jgi:DNA-binding transcriptional ArsR family regulator